MKKQNILLSIIIFATFTRVALPPFFGHLPNFSALDALALFCGAYCERRIIAIAICLTSVWVGDMLLTHTLFYPGFYWQYGCYALMTLLGASISHVIASSRLAMTSLTCSTLFFLITNFGVWFSDTMYPQTLDGLIACYVAAIPFFKNSLISDLVFTGVLFGSMQFLGIAPAHKPFDKLRGARVTV